MISGVYMEKYLRKMLALLVSISISAALISCGEVNSSSEESTALSEESTALSEESTASSKESTVSSAEGTAESAESATESALSFSEASGFYSAEFDLAINSPGENWKIYYTLDGSIPDEKSKIYSAPLHMKNATNNMNVLSAQKNVNPSGDYIPKDKVLKGNVVRAIAIDDQGNRTDVISATYFVGIDREKLFRTAPVISMYTDFDNLFGYEDGIYVLGKSYDDWIAEDPKNKRKEGWEKHGNFKNKGKEWEREARIEYLPYGDGDGFSIDLGIRIMGAASRGNMQKSFRLKCREEYGEKNLKYDLIPDNLRSDGIGEVGKYKSFVLRDGGNDCDYTKFRDPLLQDLVENRSFETQQSDACVLFIDGEYWGMYAICEDYSDNYIENNYGIDNDNVVIIKRGEVEEGREEDIGLYNELRDFITGNDMSVAANYEKACEMLDIQSYIEYCAFNIYIDNQDSYFKDNNWQMWRVRKTDAANPYADGKWRMMAFDTEFSTGLYSDGKNQRSNSFKNALKEKATGGRMFSSLMENEQFKNEFVRTLCDMRNIDFEWSRVEERIQYYTRLYGPLVPDTLKRFGPDWVIRWNDPVKYFDDKVKEVKTWLKGRYDTFFATNIKKTMDTGDAVSVMVMSSDYEKGGFSLNTSSVVFKEEFKGEYFSEFGFEVNAHPRMGAGFDHWEVVNGTVSDEKSETALIYPEENCRVTAVYN